MFNTKRKRRLAEARALHYWLREGRCFVHIFRHTRQYDIVRSLKNHMASRIREYTERYAPSIQENR